MDTSLLAGFIFFVAFVGIILVHEFGHYVAARALGVEIEEFGIGLPPRAWRFWRSKGRITLGRYTLDLPPNFDFPRNPLDMLQRGVTVLARRQGEHWIVETLDFSPLDADRLRQTPPEPTPLPDGRYRFDGLLHDVSPGTEFTLNWLPLGGFVRPKGENDPSVPGGLAAAAPWRRLVVLIAGATMNLLAGFLIFLFLVSRDGYRNFNRVMLTEIAPDSPAEAAGMQVGDVVLYANGQAVENFDMLSQVIRAHLGQPVTFVLQRGNQRVTVTAIPRPHPPEGEGPLGIRMSEQIVPPSSVGEVVRYAGLSVYQQVRALLLLPAQLLRGRLSPDEGRFVGLKGIYDIFNFSVTVDMKSREEALSSQAPISPTYSTLYLIASLTISIGLINLLPVPALDGGRILFVLPELITRRRVPHQFENAVHAVGMIMLILFMIYINIMDFLNPVTLSAP